MPSNQDWLPKNHEGLYDQSNLTFNYLMEPANRDRFGFTPSSPQGQWLDEKAMPLWARFSSAFTDWLDPAHRTPGKTVTLLDAEKAFKPVYREVYNGFLRDNPLVTGLDLTNMGLPQRSSGERHPTPVADESPECEIDTNVIRCLIIYFFARGHKHKKGKLTGQHGGEFLWAILDAPPTSISDLTNSSFDTHSPIKFTFDENQRGKTFYFVVRWENTTGQKGPWSAIYSVVIP
jgi:hypothetical protein